MTQSTSNDLAFSQMRKILAGEKAISGEHKDALDKFRGIVNASLMPQQIIINRDDGGTLGVIAQSRRCSEICSIDPVDEWQGDGEPLYGPLDAMSSMALEATIIDFVQGGKCTVEHKFLSAIKRITDSEIKDPDLDRARAFFEAGKGMARGIKGRSVKTDIPVQSRVTQEWIRDSIRKVEAANDGSPSAIYLYTVDGTQQLALGAGRWGSTAVVVLAENERDIGILTKSVNHHGAEV